jgi:hypothetical protein
MNVQDLLLGRTCYSCWLCEFYRQHPDNEYPTMWCRKRLRFVFADGSCKVWNDENRRFVE